MATKIGVGIIGSNPSRGWALAAHIPALRANPDYELRAVSATRRESSEASARALGVELAFDDHRALLANPAIDLAVVSVKSTDHFQIAKDAIAAGKMILCEWPVGRNLQETENLAAAARQKGVRTAIGLQMRFSPVVRYVRDLVAEGWIGTLLGTSVVAAGPDTLWTGILEPPYEFAADPRNGTTLLTIPAGHALDGVAFALGEFREVSSTLIARRGKALRTRDNVVIPWPAEDQIAFSGTLTSGALASVHYHGGPSGGRDFVWEINGSEGNIVVSAEHGYANMADLELQGARGSSRLQTLPLPPKYHSPFENLPMPARNVAALYAQFARDAIQDTQEVPNFEDAVRRKRLLDAIERSNATGTRQTV